ncbi:MAG: zf-HC2 domain-containing protein [Acidimicrobiia bacterium]
MGVGRFDHLRTQRLLDAYADDELDPQRAVRVISHLIECPKCRHDLLLTDRMKAHLALRRLAAFDRLGDDG